MNHFIDSYYSSVFNSVTRLTGLADEKELKALTEEILGELSQRIDELTAESHKGVFVYKVVLTHVFSFLAGRSDKQRIEFLQKILLIHPSHYTQLADNKNPPHGTNRQGEGEIEY
ncbi:hypothetical protein [Puia dinghuensis]|uniref:Uncharacterized protein n=1 Tax=Puia dinghuensis TaxID=1792502 RepID=A0A8J2UCV7_9BACT|nr:hypothetical protein [Puia dinghuensis]GGA99386.1 hypothetical protein GCM10011511_23380 [Puia dinghuensis]